MAQFVLKIEKIVPYHGDSPGTTPRLEMVRSILYGPDYGSCFRFFLSPKVVTIRISIKLNNMSINVYTYVPIKNFMQEKNIKRRASVLQGQQIQLFSARIVVIICLQN